MRCEICGREASSQLCDSHKKAYENLVEKYKVWKEAADITWTEYLNEILRNPNSGLWVKEVAKQLLSQQSVKE